MAGVFSGGEAFIDPAGRPLSSLPHPTSDQTDMAPLLDASLDLDLRVMHHDHNINR